jgi:hypothetical protein
MGFIVILPGTSKAVTLLPLSDLIEKDKISEYEAKGITKIFLALPKTHFCRSLHP